MDVRHAEIDDAPVIREIARRSLEASYTLSPQTIESAVVQWYDDETIEAAVTKDDSMLLVVEHDDADALVALSEAQILDDASAELLWLHVDPDYRGEGIAMMLFEATKTTLTDRGITQLRGRVLRDNPGGNDFYREAGFAKVGETRVTIDGTDYVENIYALNPTDVETITAPDGREVYLDREERDRGSVAPFLNVYSDRGKNDRYGYFCANCEQLANAMDAMGRIECPNCGNQRKPTRWDAAYL